MVLMRDCYQEMTQPESELKYGARLTGPSGYIPTLDGWRAIAILAVLFHHAMIPLLGAHPWLRFSEQGSLGVDVFFALSGFLICSRLLHERAKTGFIDLKAFYLRRSFRILPPYLTYLAVLLIMASFGLSNLHLADWLSCLTFTRNYIPGHLWSWETGHFWSLSVEEHFYLIFPSALILLGSRRLRHLLPWFVAAVTLWRMADYRLHLFDHVFAGVPSPYRTDVRLDGIALGALAALIVAVPSLKDAFRRRLTGRRIAAAALLLLTVTFVAIPMAVLLQKLLIAALVAATALRPDLLVTRWLEAKWLRWIGRLSYSLYIWQQMFFVPSQNAIGRVLAKSTLLVAQLPDATDRAWILQMPVLAAGTLAMALMSFYLVERPVLKWGAHYLKARNEAKHGSLCIGSAEVPDLAPTA